MASSDTTSPSARVGGRLVLENRILPGWLRIEDGRIVAVEPDAAKSGGPYICPGCVDTHVHGWGGYDAMGGPDALSGMARALLRHGITAFLPTAVAAPLETLVAFADDDAPSQIAGGKLQLWLASSHPMVLQYPGRARGPALLAAQPELEVRLIAWLEKALG